MTRVEFYVGSTLEATVTSSPYAAEWDTLLQENGTYTVTARAYDAAGNTATSAEVTVTVANDIRSFGATTPGTQVDQPGQGYKFGSIFTLTEHATASSLRFYARGGSASQRFVPAVYQVNAAGVPTTLLAQGSEVTVAAGRSSGWVTSSLPAVTMTPGRYLLSVVAGPTSGGASLYFAAEVGGGGYNQNSYPAPSATWGAFNPMGARWSFALDYQATPAVPDTQAPSVVISTPANGSTVSDLVSISAEAADDIFVTRVEIFIDGALFATMADSPYSIPWDTVTTANGAHTVTAKAYDAAGNVSTSEAVTVSVSNLTVASDDFSGPLEPSRWTFVDPAGDSTATVNGTQAEISVPAGASHYVWTGGAQAPRLMQPVNNRDFEVEAKFQSNLANQTQIQGILIEQDANNFVRFDISQEYCQAQLAGATVAGSNGTGWFVRNVRSGADVYLRVRRTGDDWSLSYSYDGRAWTNSGTFTKALNVARVGPFAGNSGAAGSAPAFTAKVDYFVNRALPPATEDGATFALPPAPPAIDVWYGDTQNFGQNGRPQEWVNVLGEVADPDGLSSLTYTLNGGPQQVLSMGEDSTRLVAPGDFNVELPYVGLNAGPNSVEIRAVDKTGAVATRAVTVNNVTGVVPPTNRSIDWSNVSQISDVAQISDGQWRLEPDGTVRTSETGYDRLIEVGDMSWTNYEVSAEVTVWDMPCGGAAVGLVAGWNGHTAEQYGVTRPNQPRIGHPFPVFGEYLLSPHQAPRLSLGANTARFQEAELIGDFSGRQLTLGVPYVFKLRTELNQTGGSHFSFKAWPAGAAEPAGWDLEFDGDRSQGSVVLASHGADASFGNVTVTGL